MENIAIHSIYKATEGEGIQIGNPQVFVRTQGCSIGCINCDSKETWEFSAPNMSISQCIDAIDKELSVEYGKLNRVSITGGDPLHPKHVPSIVALIKELKSKGIYVNIEAAGTRVVDEIFCLVDFISMDYKTPSTGVKTNLKLLEKFLKAYGNKSQIKSVVADKKDFEMTYEAFTQLREFVELSHTPWVLTPCYDPAVGFEQEVFQNTIELNHSFGAPFKVIGQQHKFIYGTKNLKV